MRPWARVAGVRVAEAWQDDWRALAAAAAQDEEVGTSTHREPRHVMGCIFWNTCEALLSYVRVPHRRIWHCPSPWPGRACMTWRSPRSRYFTFFFSAGNMLAKSPNWCRIMSGAHFNVAGGVPRGGGDGGPLPGRGVLRTTTRPTFNGRKPKPAGHRLLRRG